MDGVNHNRRRSISTIPIAACFLVACLAGVRAADADEPTKTATALTPSDDSTGTLEGIVTYQGEVPKSTVPDDAGQRRPLLIVQPATRGLRYVAVFLAMDANAKNKDASPTLPANDARPKDAVVIDQKEHTFEPHLVAIRAGQPVRFTNSDTANHNVRASSLQDKNQFNIFTGAGGDYRHQFVADRNRPVLLSCDIHPWMRGWIYVFDHPYFSVTDVRGEFKIERIPAGTHRVLARQPAGGLNSEQSVEIQAGKVTRVEFRFTAEQIKGG